MDDYKLWIATNGRLAMELRRSNRFVYAIVLMKGLRRGVRAFEFAEFKKLYDKPCLLEGKEYPVGLAATKWLLQDSHNLIRLSDRAKKELQMIVGIKEGMFQGRLEDADAKAASRTFPSGTKIFKSAEDLKKLNMQQLITIHNAAVSNEPEKVVTAFKDKAEAVARVWAVLEGMPLSEIPELTEEPKAEKVKKFYVALDEKEGDRMQGGSDRMKVYEYLAQGKVATTDQIAEALSMPVAKVETAMSCLINPNRAGKCRLATPEEVEAGSVAAATYAKRKSPEEVEAEKKAAKEAKEAEKAEKKAAKEAEKAAKEAEKEAAKEKPAEETAGDAKAA